MARGLKLRILEIEGLHYLCTENKGYRVADLRLCFRIYAIKQVCHHAAHNVSFSLQQRIRMLFYLPAMTQVFETY